MAPLLQQKLPGDIVLVVLTCKLCIIDVAARSCRRLVSDRVAPLKRWIFKAAAVLFIWLTALSGSVHHTRLCRGTTCDTSIDAYPQNPKAVDIKQNAVHFFETQMDSLPTKLESHSRLILEMSATLRCFFPVPMPRVSPSHLFFHDLTLLVCVCVADREGGPGCRRSGGARRGHHGRDRSRGKCNTT